MCVRVCVCVRETEREGGQCVFVCMRERDRERERERLKERSIDMKLFFIFMNAQISAETVSTKDGLLLPLGLSRASLFYLASISAHLTHSRLIVSIQTQSAHLE